MLFYETFRLKMLYQPTTDYQPIIDYQQLHCYQKFNLRKFYRTRVFDSVLIRRNLRVR